MGQKLLCLSFLLFTSCTAELGVSDDGVPNNYGNTNNNSGSNDNSEAVAGVTDLTCDTFVWCSNWKSNAETPQLPDVGGTTIEDGLYRLEAGSETPIALAFKGNRFARILPRHLNLYGTFRTSGNKLYFTNEMRCDEDEDFSISSPTETGGQKFRVDGNQLYFYDDVCDYVECGPTWRFVKVEDLCSSSRDFGCSNGSCVCDLDVNRGFQNVGSCSE